MSADQRANRPGLLGYSDAMIRRFRLLAPLSQEDLDLLREITSRGEAMRAGSELGAGPEAAPRPRILLSGWCCRQRVLPDGRRQIFSFVLPGDAVGLSGALHPMAHVSTVALTSVRVADATALAKAIAAPSPRHAALKRACDLAAGLEQAQLLDHVVRLGRQSAAERLAHLLLELRDRMAVLGHAQAERFSMALTQEMLADALGLSVVHVNRTLQQMKRERLIETRPGSVRLLEPERLAAIADYRSVRPDRAA